MHDDLQKLGLYIARNRSNILELCDRLDLIVLSM